MADPTGKGRWLTCRCQYHAICQDCGGPITDDREHPDHRGLCAACARAQLTAGRPPEDRHELVSLLTERGLSADVPISFHLKLGEELDDDWRAYRIEWALIPDHEYRRPPFPHVLRPPWRVNVPGFDAPMIILRWRQWRIDGPEFLERRWQRDGASWAHRWQVRTNDQVPSPRRVRELAQLMSDRKGPGRDPEDLDAWLDDLREEIAATLAAGKEPDQGTVADRMGLSLPGLQKKLGRLNNHRGEDGRRPVRWKRLVADIRTALRH